VRYGAALLLLALAAPAPAGNEPDDLVKGKIVVVVAGKSFRFAGMPAAAPRLDLPDAANDPTLAGGTLRISDTANAARGVTFDLPAGDGWRRIPRQAARPLEGYRYRGAGSAADPCRLVIVKPKIVKATCTGPGVAVTPPFAGDVAVVLTLGTESKRYCAAFGGRVLGGKPRATKRKGAPPPAACAESCACGASRPQGVGITAGVGSGSCGSITGATTGSIACGALYFGGGLGSVPLPIVVPDFAQPTRLRVDACDGVRLTVAGTTPDETGGNDRGCTTPGCLFGPPLPVPNALSTPTSTCLYNVVAEAARGTIACDTGAASVTLPVFANVYLTGDRLPNRCQGGSNPGGRCTAATQATDCPGGACQPDPEIQPCPICNPVTRVCNAGLDNGKPCVPASTETVTGAFPTSQDCRIDESLKFGVLDARLELTTGTAADTAGPSGTQPLVFCGFCRDADGTGAFQQPPAPCEANAGCAQPFEACEQRSQGAFRDGVASALSAAGSPAGPLADFGPHAATLVTVFCIPPVYNGIIDGQADLPGPGALTFSGTVQLSATLAP
jgi:hypothetical protein